jgi:hypothetical protein
MAARESVELSFRADIGDLRKNLAAIPGITEKEARKMAAALEKQMMRAEKAAGKAAKRSRDEWGKTASRMATGALAAGAAIGVLAQDVADTRNGLTDLSTRSGVARDTIAGLKLAAEGSGLAFSDLEPILGKMPKLIADVARGSKTQADAFAALGVEATNADGSLRDSDTVMRELLAGIGKLPTPTDKAAAAMSVFGTQGAKLLQALGDPAALDAYVAMAGQSAINSEAAATGAGNWQRSMAELNLQLDNTKALLIDNLGVTGFVDDFVLGLTFINAAVASFANEAVTRLGLVSDVFGNLADGEFMAAGRAANELANKLYNPIESFRVLTAGVEAGSEAMAQFRKNRDAVRAASSAITPPGPPGPPRGTGSGAKEAAEEITDAMRAAEKWRDTILKAAQDAESPLQRQARLYEDIALAEHEGGLTSEEVARAKIIVLGQTNEALRASHDAEMARQRDAASIVTQATDHRLSESERLLAEEAEVMRRLVETEAATQEQITAIHEEYTRRRSEASQAEDRAREMAAIATATTMAGSFADIGQAAYDMAKQGSKRAARIFHVTNAMRAAEIIGSSISAAAAALLPPPIGLGPIIGPILAGVTIAGGAVRAASVASQSPPSFNDTPGMMQVGGSPAVVQFAPGDFFAAGQDRGEVARQAIRGANDAGDGMGAPMVQVVPMAIYKGRTWETGQRDSVTRPGALARALRDARQDSGTGRGGY